MNQGQTVFAQLVELLPRRAFENAVHRYDGQHRVRSFSCMDQLLCMIFAQVTGRASLRETVTCLRAIGPRRYHCGIRGPVSRSTLADANNVRDWRIYADFAQILIAKARALYVNDSFGVELDHCVYALDSTTIDLCLAVFPWAQFRKRKAAVKLHTLLDLRGNIPSVVIVTSGKVHDVRIMDQLRIEPGAIYIVDRGYIDFARLHRIHLAAGFFVTRAKNNFRFQRLYSQPVTSAAVRCDQVVVPRNFYARRDYPSKLRRISYVDPET